ERGELLERTQRLVTTVGADLGVGFDRPGERIYVVDEEGTPVPLDQALLLFIRLLAWTGRGGRIAVPVTSTSQVEAVAEGLGGTRGDGDAGVAAGLDSGGDGGGDGLRGRHGWRLRLPGLPARLRLDRVALQAARAAGAPRPAALPARLRAAAADARPPRGAVPVGAQ